MELATQPSWHPERLPTGRESELLDLGLAAAAPWGPDELAAAWEYHLTAPLLLEIEGFDPGRAAVLRGSMEPGGQHGSSLHDLLAQPEPTRELIELVKDFAKGCLHGAESPLPAAVAGVLYYLAIAVGVTRLGERISRLGDAEIRRGLEWALGQSWVDTESRTMLAQAYRLVAESGATFDTGHGG